MTQEKQFLDLIKREKIQIKEFLELLEKIDKADDKYAKEITFTFSATTA